MLLDDLSKSIKAMKLLDTRETDRLTAEKRAKNDADFASLVDEFGNSVSVLKEAITMLDYRVSLETVQTMEDCSELLRGVIDDGVAESSKLYDIRQHISKKMLPNLSKEWKSFHQGITGGPLAKLHTLGRLVTDEKGVTEVRERIAAGDNWNNLSMLNENGDSRLIMLKNGLDEIIHMEEGLNLNDNVRAFIDSVTKRNAKVSDITEDIVNWIKKEGLEDRFIVAFRV